MLITWWSEAILLGDDIHFHEAFVINQSPQFVCITGIKGTYFMLYLPTWEARLKKNSQDGGERRKAKMKNIQ